MQLLNNVSNLKKLNKIYSGMSDTAYRIFTQKKEHLFVYFTKKCLQLKILVVKYH